MGRRASPGPAILTGPEQILGACWLSSFCAAPRPVQQALLAVGRHAPGRSVRWGSLRRFRPFSSPYGYDRGTPVDRYYIERFLAEHAERIRGDMLEVKDADYSRRFGNEVRYHVVDLGPESTEADLHAGLNIPGSLPAEVFDCVILTQVLQFLAPEQVLRNVWASIAPGGTLLITVPTLGRLDPHLVATDFWQWTPRGLAELLGRVGMPARGTEYGNVLACVAALWGLSVQDLSAEELYVNNPCFPLVACAHADKPA